MMVLGCWEYRNQVHVDCWGNIPPTSDISARADDPSARLVARLADRSLKIKCENCDVVRNKWHCNYDIPVDKQKDINRNERNNRKAFVEKFGYAVLFVEFPQWRSLFFNHVPVFGFFNKSFSVISFISVYIFSEMHF